MRRRGRLVEGLIAGLGLLLPVSLAAQPPPMSGAGGAGRIREARDLQEAWEVLSGLISGERLRLHLAQARALLEHHGVSLPAAEWERVHQKLRARDYEQNPDRRKTAQDELTAAVDPIKDALFAALPAVGAFDAPNDDGTKLIVLWRPHAGAQQYLVERLDVRPGRQTNWEQIRTAAPIPGSAFELTDDSRIYPSHRYRYRVSAVDAQGQRTLLGETGEVTATAQWFNFDQLGFLIFVLVLCGAVIVYIQAAQRGVRLTIRKIAGLDAVDEAVGRATEMGRPILFVPGIQDMNDIQTVAGLIVLGRVARVAAEHDAQIEVPTSRSLVMTAARETVATSYLNAGRPDAYDEKKIYYVTDEQFGYVAAVTGTMVREKPATCFYMGSFFAESLILAETANLTGSIQIAGTAQPAQLPFFVAACDYTLIGEEFFAASAYLSGEPQQLGSLKGQDVGKLLVMLFVFVGTVLATLVETAEWRHTVVGDALDYMVQRVLNTGGG